MAEERRAEAPPSSASQGSLFRRSRPTLSQVSVMQPYAYISLILSPATEPTGKATTTPTQPMEPMAAAGDRLSSRSMTVNLREMAGVLRGAKRAPRIRRSNTNPQSTLSHRPRQAMAGPHQTTTMCHIPPKRRLHHDNTIHESTITRHKP